jgi:hypothetical protein
LEGHVARLGATTNAYKNLVPKLKGKDRLEELGVDGRVVLKSMLKKWGVRVWTGLIWPRIGSSCGPL